MNENSRLRRSTNPMNFTPEQTIPANIRLSFSMIPIQSVPSDPMRALLVQMQYIQAQNTEEKHLKEPSTTTKHTKQGTKNANTRSTI